MEIDEKVFYERINKKFSIIQSDKIFKILHQCEPPGLPVEAQVSQENGGQVEAFKWALEKMETATDRFIFNEKFILGLYQSWWKRLFAKHYIGKHLDETLSRFSG